MFRHRSLVQRLLGITLLATPAVAHAQTYVGVALGIGGADVPIGSYASGFRGAFQLRGGYEVNEYFAMEAMTINLGEPDDKPAGSLKSTINGVGAVAVGTLHAERWRFSGRLGLMSMEGKAIGASTERSAQPIVGLAVGYDLHPKITLGLEKNVSKVKFGTPISDTVSVNWTAVSVLYRF
jgi:Outer membrane protein beta-barrel domain